MEVQQAISGSEVPHGTVDAVVNRIAGSLNVEHALLVDQVVVLLANEHLWVGQGMTTMTAWLRWRCGMSTSTARSIVAVAERVDELPESVAAFRRGELSLDQIASIARRAPSWTDGQALQYAVEFTVAQLRRVLASYPFPDAESDERHGNVENHEDDGDDEDDAHAVSESDDAAPAAAEIAPDANCLGMEPAVGFEESCSLFRLDDGTFRLTAHLDADTGRTVRAGLDEAHDRLFNNGQADVTLADALRLMAEQSLGSVSDRARRSRFKIALHLDTDTGALLDAAGSRLPDAIRRHITCDGTIRPVFCESGLPVSVGRAQHIVPARTRTVVEQRDGACCRVPGCTTTVGLEVHHIIHWEHDGPTDTWNLVLVCGPHHRMHHQGRLGISGNADDPNGLVFRNQHGALIARSGAAPDPPPEPRTVSECGDRPRYRHPDGGRLDSSLVWFQPPAAFTERARQRLPDDDDYFRAIGPRGC